MSGSEGDSGHGHEHTMDITEEYAAREEEEGEVTETGGVNGGDGGVTVNSALVRAREIIQFQQSYHHNPTEARAGFASVSVSCESGI